MCPLGPSYKLKIEAEGQKEVHQAREGGEEGGEEGCTSSPAIPYCQFPSRGSIDPCRGCGVVRCDAVQCSVVRCGAVRCGAAAGISTGSSQYLCERDQLGISSRQLGISTRQYPPEYGNPAFKPRPPAVPDGHINRLGSCQEKKVAKRRQKSGHDRRKKILFSENEKFKTRTS